MPQARLLRAPPSSSALPSASPAPRPCASPLQLLLSFPLAHASLARVPTRRRLSPPPRHPRRPGQAAARATSAQPGVHAEPDRRLGPKPTARRQPGEGSPEEAGAQASLLCERGRREAQGTRSLFLERRTWALFHERGSGAFTPKRGVEGRAHGKRACWDSLVDIFPPTRRDLLAASVKAGLTFLEGC